MNRIIKVIHMQLVNKQTFVWIPLIVLAAALVFSFVVFGVLRATVVPEGPITGGGVQAPLWYLLAVGITATSYTFPFSQALSITRRDFYFGTLLAGAGAAALTSLVIVLGSWIESLTEGFGMNAYFFRVAWISDSGPVVTFLFWFVAGVLLFSLGFWLTTVYKRFGALGLILTLVAIVAVLLLAFASVAWANGWASLYNWGLTTGALSITAVLTVVTVLVSAVSYRTLLKATP